MDGYHSREVESFGNPIIDQDANRELFEEQVEVMMKAFHQRSFSHHGKYYDIPPQVPYRGSNWRRRWCPGPATFRWNAGSPWSARASAVWTSWPGTASRASSEAERLPADGQEVAGDARAPWEGDRGRRPSASIHIAETEQEAIQDIFHENMDVRASHRPRPR